MPTNLTYDETQRLQVLCDYHVLDTPKEQEFDDIATLVAQICCTPIALISLVDGSRQWFKARVGIDVMETPRELSFCAHALHQNEPLVIQDATLDARFSANPLVTGAPHIRFYAGAPLVAPGGEVLGTLCVVDLRPRDLTPEQLRALSLLAHEVMTHLELRRNLRELRGSESRYRQLFEQHPLPIWVSDSETARFLAVNDAAVAHYGYSRSEFLRMTLGELLNPGSAEMRPGIEEHRSKHGQVIRIETETRPIEFDGRAAEIVLAMDVTSKFEAEEALRSSNILRQQTAESQAAILNALPAHIALLDPRGVIRAVNESWRRFALANSAVSSDYFVGENYIEVCDAAVGDCSREAAQISVGLRGVLSGELPSYVMEYPCHSPTEENWFRLTVTPLNEYSRDGAVVMHVNITERKVAEKALEKANIELREVSRLTGMADVATSVLHNVGNVLNSVNVSCSIIAEKVRKSRISSLTRTAELLHQYKDDLAGFFTVDPRGRGLGDYLGSLASRLEEEQAAVLLETESLSRNIDHIKGIISVQQGHAKDRSIGSCDLLSIADLVEDALRLSQLDLTHHHIRLVREFDEVPPAPMHRHKVLQILVNLLCNAKEAVIARFGGMDGQIVIRIECVDSVVRVSIADNGVGIAQQDLTRIFAQGFTTKIDGHGFGLHSGALAAQEMGGSLSVHSDGPGTGSTFSLLLAPRRGPAEDPQRPIQPPSTTRISPWT